jgi:D-inositol-3-phosphate glycosyltransferase
MEKRIKLLIHGDAVTPTGFGRVLHSIAENLPKDEYDIAWLGINYYGDPHDYPYRIYPAAIGGDVWGIGRVAEMVQREQPDILFILNDIWIIMKVLDALKGFNKLPKIVTYFPVDGTDFAEEWFKDFGKVDRTVVYTKFAKDVVDACKIKDLNVSIIPHGSATKTFYPIQRPKAEIKALLYPPEFADSFIVLNANRNQPRKRIDIFLEAFKLFSDGKPENVKMHCHMGLVDAGWPLSPLAVRYGIDTRLIVSNENPGVQTVSDKQLNIIYNATDLGVNTGIGEGWGLVNTEHAAVGVPQIVSDHSACHELFEDCGILVPAPIKIVDPGLNITHYASKAEDVAAAMEKVYTDKTLYAELAKKGYDKFTSEKYSWISITRQWDSLFKNIMNEPVVPVELVQEIKL